MNWSLINGTVVNSNEIHESGYVSIQGDQISAVGKSISGRDGLQIDVSGCNIYPGLINCHDHLLGTYWPRVGDRRPYLNWLEWDNDLKLSPVYAERQKIESPDLYKMGAFRHLICGVTTVQDHIPHFVRELFAKDLSIKVADQFAMAHSIGSFALKWGDGIVPEHRKALENNIPFITHCSEGFDQETINSVKVLAEHNALSERTVLVHGIAFSDEDIALLAENRCNVVWCPVSNLYMFQKTARVKELIEQGVNVVLGTDSPMSGSTSMVEELHLSREYYQSFYGEELDPKVQFEMVTSKAAQALCLKDRGSIKKGNAADLLVLRSEQSDPYRALVGMDYNEVMLVVIDGEPVYADPSFESLLDNTGVSMHRVCVDGVEKLIKNDVMQVVNRIREAVGFKKILDFLPVEEV